ncbi:DUF188 domain-containing protein [Bacillus shivajii]|uniref:YaiI/YqxD family protein n=1 Tax=Bacillus shivajii TaxID=1983719 RepID=UPI001CFA3C14|nr:DUF188 domain-containing protein [Bacillus shivajii]UCZ54512.1 DUF188 domain-containing protein [Bacillus shivajii]
MMRDNKKQIFVDGDACPVLNEIIEVANNYAADVTVVSSYAHFRTSTYPDFVSYVFVDQEREAADLKIINLIGKEDIAITEDLGLASLLLGKGVTTLHPRGKQITLSEIEYLLDMRHDSGKRRRAGLRTKGPKKYTNEDKQIFQKELEKILSNKEDF